MITAYCGTNGAGKTVLAVDSCLRRMKKTGRRLYSTVDIYDGGDWVEIDENSPRENVGGVLLTHRIESWEQLMTVRRADILLDEVVTLASGRESLTLPPEVLAWIESLRHRKTMFTWTSPLWMDADVKLRGITQQLIIVKPLIRGRRAEDDPYRRTIISAARRYDTRGRAGEPPGEDEKGRRSFYRLSKTAGFGKFDTYADVARLSEFGKCCSRCKGRIVRPICKCSRAVP